MPANAARAAATGRAVLESLETRVLFAAGDLDPSFGAGGTDGPGIVSTNLAPGSTAQPADSAQAVVIDANGRILAGGFTDPGNLAGSDFALARYNPDGTLDTTFGGGDGIVTTDLGDSDVIQSIALTPDGHIVAVGTTGTGSFSDWAVVRYNADGTIDTTFGAGGGDGDGIVITDFAGRADSANGVAVDANNRIVVTGTATDNTSDIAVVRYNPNGTLDASFGAGGDDGDGVVIVDFLGGADTGSEVKVQGDNRIIVVAASAPPAGYRRFVLLRFNENGSPDTTFGAAGAATADFGGTAFAKDVALIPGGGYVVGGLVDLPGGAATTDFAVAKFNANGSLDTSFGAGGRSVAQNVSGLVTAHYGLARQDDGKLLFGGLRYFPGPPESTAFGLTRFNPDGTLDTNFGTVGTVTTTVPEASRSAGADVALQGDGRIVMVGEATPSSPTGAASNFVVIRYLNDVSALGSISGAVFEDVNANGVRDAGEPGLAGWTVFQDLNNNGRFESGGGTVPSTDVPKNIRDNGTITSTLTVSNLSAIIDLNVTLAIEHTFDPDLVVTLISPAGTRVELFSDVGLTPGDTGNANFDNTTLDDQATTSIRDGRPPFRGSFRPEEALSTLNGQNPNGVWKLEVTDTAAEDVGKLNSWSLSFTSRGEPAALTDAAGNFSFPNLAPGSYMIRQVTQAGFTQTAPATGSHVITLAAGQNETGRNFGNVRGTAPTAVVGREVFYNHSRFDGRDANASETDINAIATDKQALLPGHLATFNNVTSYSRGINGVLVELRNLAPSVSLTAADFQFRAGNGTDPSLWAAAPAPAQVVTLRSALPEDPARVLVTWADGAIVNKWLQVTVLRNANTGLLADDVFYFGNLAGETGDQPFRLVNVSTRDELLVRRNLGTRNAAVTNRYDFDRDGDVDTMDMLVVRRNMGARLSSLGGPDTGTIGTTLDAARVWDEQAPGLL
jgi:uncharacterized delta-60 repeat protein